MILTQAGSFSTDDMVRAAKEVYVNLKNGVVNRF